MSRESVFFSHFSKWFDVTKNENLSAIRTPLTPPFFIRNKVYFLSPLRARHAHLRFKAHLCVLLLCCRRLCISYLFFFLLGLLVGGSPTGKIHDEKIIHEHETNSLGGSQRREETRRRTDETRRSEQRRRRGCKTTNSLEQEGFLRSTTDEYE